MSFTSHATWTGDDVLTEEDEDDEEEDDEDEEEALPDEVL